MHRQGLRSLRSWPRTEAGGPLEGRKTFCAAALLISAFLFFCADFFVQQGSFRAVPMSGWKNANTASIEIEMQTMVVFLREKAFGMEKSKNLAFVRAWIFELFCHFLIFRQRHVKMPKNAVYYD